MFRFINKLFFRSFETSQPVLGRWKLKSCDDVMNKVNVFYQNRDHCGDFELSSNTNDSAFHPHTRVTSRE